MIVSLHVFEDVPFRDCFDLLPESTFFDALRSLRERARRLGVERFFGTPGVDLA